MLNSCNLTNLNIISFANKTASQSKEINQKSKDLVWIQEINLHSHESIRNQSKIKGLNLEWKDHWLLLDCELGAWNPVFGNVDFWKMWILEKCEFWKNVYFGKMWILGKWEFWELVNFGKMLIFWNLNVGKLLDFAKCVAWACRMIFHSCFSKIQNLVNNP